MMICYLDSSAWVKRHQKENGSDWMARLWQPTARFGCANLGLIEVLSTVVRRHAANHVEDAITRAVLESVRRDFAAFVQIDLNASVLTLAQSLPIRHRLRGADCVHLASAMRLRELQSAAVVFIASDVELLAAAVAEGFSTLDPAHDPAMPQIT
jgi:predicted nucleic acid-binding protein